jgi:endonuclease/exonuclease/phosphatase family metal-dependent hydrolase
MSRPARWSLLAAATFTAVMLATAGESAPPAPPLRFVTLNVLHGGPLSGWTGKDGHLEARLDLVTEALRALGPDVIALQEASRSRARGEVASRLAGRLGMNHVYSASSMRLFDTLWINRAAAFVMDFSEGPAILSRFPILRSEILPLPRCGRWLDPRVLLFVELATPGGRLPVFSTHTSGHACHAQAVGAMVRQRRGDLPGVLMGDLNSVESSAAMAALASEIGFVDAFRAIHPEDPGFTVYQPVTVPERRVRRRVDYVLVVPGRAFAGEVVDSRVVVDAPGRLPDGTYLWPSDHYGVLADVRVHPDAEPRTASPGEAPGAAGRAAPGKARAGDGNPGDQGR